MEIRVISSYEAFREMKDEWTALLAELDPIPLPLTHDWIDCWWRAFSNGREMAFRCAYVEGRVKGIAPLYRSKENYRGVPVNILRIAANGHSPFSSIVVSPTLSEEDQRSVLTSLIRTAGNEVCQLWKVNIKSDVVRFFRSDDGDKHKMCGMKPSIVTPFVRVDQPWQEFYASRPRKFRKSLNHKLNRFDKDGQFTVSEMPLTSAFDATMENIVAISEKSWKASIGNDLKANIKSREFLSNLIECFGKRGDMKVWMVKRKEIPVAYELHLHCDGIVYPIRADYNEAFKAYSPGSVLECIALKSIFENGSSTQYYTCADNYWYLRGWASDYETYCNLEVFGSSPKMKMLYRLEYRAIPAIKRLIGRNDRLARPV